MKRIPSGQFRRTYASLDEPVIVTANGHMIGLWRPFTSEEAELMVIEIARSAAMMVEMTPKGGERRPMSQAERDAILRRVNKGG